MNILVVMIPLSILLLIGAGVAFFWAVEHDQFDDLDTPKLLPLLDDPASPTGQTPQAPEAKPDSPGAESARVERGEQGEPGANTAALRDCAYGVTLNASGLPAGEPPAPDAATATPA